MRTIRESLAILLVLTGLCGLVYPLAITAVAQAIFPGRANGSLIHRDGRIVGSELIGQPFHSPAYLWARPSATSGQPYNAGASGGSNLGPLNADLASAAQERIQALRAQPGADPQAPVPIDLVTASGGGLDPHISPAAALYQTGRIARARGVPVAEIDAVVRRHIEPRTLGLFGEARVNVLLVNLELDRRFAGPAAAGLQGCAR